MFLVRALRWGDLGAHSYIVGLYSTLELAIGNADEEAIERGGKYGCAVSEVGVDSREKKLVYYKSSMLKESKPDNL